MSDQVAATQEQKPDVPKQEEEDEQQKVLKAIAEKYKDNLALRVKLLALFRYSQIESENTEKMEKEIDQITLKYKNLSLPLLTKASEIIGGKKLQEDDVKNFEQYVEGADVEKKAEILAKEPKAIEDYWLKVLKGSFLLKEEIKAYDEEPLKALKNIEYIPSTNAEKPHDFTLKFFFAPNDYFENDVLIKEFHMTDEREASKTECTELKWKEGKDITKKTIKKKQKNKKTGASRQVTKTVDQDSFFTFFRNMEDKEKEDDEEDEEPEEELDHIDRHVDIAYTIFEEILPYSLEYYLGVRKEPDFEGLKEHLDAEDDDHDQHDHKGKKSKSKKPAAGGDPKQECKQQ